MVEAALGVMGAALLGTVAWAFQINSRVSVAENSIENLQVRIIDKLEVIDNRLERLENTTRFAPYNSLQ